MDSTTCPNDLAELRRKAAVYQRWHASGYISADMVRYLQQADAKEMDRTMDCCVVQGIARGGQQESGAVA